MHDTYQKNLIILSVILISATVNAWAIDTSDTFEIFGPHLTLNFHTRLYTRTSSVTYFNLSVFLY